MPAFFVLPERTAKTALHHEVLPIWEKWRESVSQPLRVICLDFHTDVLDCRRRGIADPVNAAEAVRVLHHDEHFDWALRHGILSSALIAAWSPCPVPPEHPALEVCRPPQLPELDVMLNEPEKYRPLAEKVLESSFLQTIIPEGIPAEPYILDIDCDCIQCEAALHPADGSFIDDLARHAVGITLSREEDWVKLLRLPGEKISGKSIAGELSDRWRENK